MMGAFQFAGPKARPIPAWGNAPGIGPKPTPERQRRGPISEIAEYRMLVPHPASKPLPISQSISHWSALSAL